MWEISIWFFAFLFAINGFLVYFDSAFADFDLISPFTNATYTPPALLAVNNTLGNITSLSGTNSTSAGNPIIGIWEVANFTWNATLFFVQFLIGSLSGSFLLSLGMPTAVLTLLYGTELIFVAITIMHFWRGIF